MLNKILVGTVLLLLLAGAVMGALWQHERGSHRKSILRLENERAATDVTHRELVRLKDGQVRVATRLAFQRKVNLDSALAKVTWAEGLTAHARAQVKLLSDSLQATTLGTAEVDEVSGTVTAHGELDAADSLGVTVAADVEVQLDPPASIWDWNVVRSPLAFSLTLGCQGTAATAALVGPPWAQFDLTEVEQDPALCNPIPRTSWQPFKLRVPSFLEVILLMGTGAVIGNLVDLPP